MDKCVVVRTTDRQNDSQVYELNPEYTYMIHFDEDVKRWVIHCIIPEERITFGGPR